MKKTLITLFFCFLMMLATCIFVSADASGVVYSESLVNNNWEYVKSEKTLYIRSNRSGYNETGRTDYSDDGAWSDFKDEIEHVVLEGAFTKVTNSAFKDHTALKDVRITAEVTQFDADCFKNCINLESITVGDNPHIKGVADLSHATYIQGIGTFNGPNGTKITKAYIAKDVYIKGSQHFAKGATVYMPKGTRAYDAYESENRYNLVDNSPVEISFVLDGKTITHTYPYGSNIQFTIVNGDCVALYTDSAFKTPYSKTNAVERDVTLYCKKLMDYVGGMVRSEEYQGLRMMYSVDENALSQSFKYRIKEYGAISIKQNGLENLLDLSTSDIDKTVIYRDGIYMGKVLSVPKGGITEFAHTATGFEGDLKDRAEQNLLFRGYIVLVNKATGEEVVSYTESIKINLAEACKKTLEINNNTESALSSEAVIFINSSLEAGAVPNYVYTKDELISLLKTVYNDNSHYIPGQHLSAYDGAISDFLNDADTASGKYPALVSFDLQDMTVLNRNSFGIIEECKEYIDMGGIVSFSWHMENPTDQEMKTESFRGELGEEAVWKALIDETTDLNKRFREILDSGADILREFDREGYPVMFRPFHEHNGDWFWWCALQGENNTKISEATFISLWQYVYNYYTNDLGLENLVWVYAPNVSDPNAWGRYTRPLAVTYGYPGERYCDIVGVDWYTKNKNVDDVVNSYNNLKTYNKPFGITEFGPYKDSGLVAIESSGKTQTEVQIGLFSCEDQLGIIKSMLSNYKLAFVVNWNGQWSMKALGKMDMLLQDATALDIYEVKDIFNGLFLTRN